MATVTVRDLPAAVIANIKQTAQMHGKSMEQEIREVLARRYGERAAVAERIRQRWPELPQVSSDQLEAWRGAGRP
jgi:plasmid stability protein